jgi:hypothetical protein
MAAPKSDFGLRLFPKQLESPPAFMVEVPNSLIEMGEK